MSGKISVEALRRGIIATAVALLLTAARTQAAEECNGFINISYPNSQIINNIGDVLQVRIDLGAGTITGGPANVLQLTQMGFDLSCTDPPGPTPNCPSEGPVISYDGDASIVTNCPGTLTSNNPAGGPVPSHLIFTFNPTVNIPNGTPIPPGFCNFTFTETILAQSSNVTGVIEQVIGYDIAQCDNGVLLSGGFQTGSVPVASPVGHFSCYQIVSGGLKTKIPVNLVDRFGTYNPTLVEAHRLCAPANKDDTDPLAPANPIHLVGYEFQNVVNPILGTATAATQFGTYTMTVKGVERLLVPSTKSLMPPPPAAPPPGLIRHFACHRTDNLKGPNVKNRVTTIEDQFSQFIGITTIAGFSNISRWDLCVPVSKNGEEPDAVTDPTGLLCLFPRDTPFPTFNLFLNN